MQAMNHREIQTWLQKVDERFDTCGWKSFVGFRNHMINSKLNSDDRTAVLEYLERFQE